MTTLIRDYREEDRDKIMHILKQGITVLNAEDEEFWFQKDHKILIYELENKEIAACCSFGCWTNEFEHHGLLFLYVVPKYRRRGFGSKLYQTIFEYIRKQELTVLEVAFRVDMDDATPYFNRLGYKKWYGLHVMSYDGGMQPDPPQNIEIVSYEDRFCEAYVEAMRQGFYEMRRVHDFRPHYCMECNENKHKELLKDKEHIFVLLENGEFAASAAVHIDEVDALGPVIVAPKYQGKGYGRIEDNSMKLKMEPYRYSDFLLNMKTMFKPQCEAKGIDITFAESTLNVYGMADKLRINQIFFNIFSNAVKYTPAGGSIRCSVENIQMDENEISGDYIIQDTGIGMSEKFQKSLFRPFTQESDEVTPELQGSGLGLSITKRLVELMGGTIHIESEQGKGTKVTVHLTFELLQEEPKQSTMKEEPKVAELDLTEKKVLLVEDHPLNAEIARRLLEKKNMLVTYAENGKIALDMFRASEINSFDVILMDIRMPVMSGLAAAEEIRSLDRSDAKTVPIIAMTANAYAEDVQRSLEAGMNAHLVKPIEPSVLYETIAKEIH